VARPIIRIGVVDVHGSPPSTGEFEVKYAIFGASDSGHGDEWLVEFDVWDLADEDIGSIRFRASDLARIAAEAGG
jgi:hypothetical protein